MSYRNVTVKSRIKNWVLAIFFVASTGGALVTTALPQTASAACATSFFGIPAWYDGMIGGDCRVLDPSSFPGGLSGFIWRIVLNVVEIILLVSGYVAAAFIIVGGFKYITSAGSPDDSVKARKTIINAVIGLVLSMSSVAIVNVVTTTVVGGVDATGIPTISADGVTLAAILNAVYFWAGAIAVLMIAIGGLLYVVSGGTASNITKAKDTIIYASVGLIIIIMAFTITQVVIGRF